MLHVKYPRQERTHLALHALSEMPHLPCLGHKVPVLQAIFTPFMFIVKVLNLITVIL